MTLQWCEMVPMYYHLDVSVVKYQYFPHSMIQGQAISYRKLGLLVLLTFFKRANAVNEFIIWLAYHQVVVLDAILKWQGHFASSQ